MIFRKILLHRSLHSIPNREQAASTRWQDHAWGKPIQFTQSKAAKAGKVVELVDARYTSQKCSRVWYNSSQDAGKKSPSLS
ncbi:MAG: hypothetical protein EHM14_15420 [Methanothrix sp.]|nr:MAG: hypothetical protein EHM14_15420 [Methanothrix sp.]